MSCMSLVVFQLCVNSDELLVHLGHFFFEGFKAGSARLAFRDRLRSAQTRDHILALSVHEVFAEEMFVPVDGSRVNATPVPQSSPMFPNTIACTFTAVPQVSEYCAVGGTLPRAIVVPA